MGVGIGIVSSGLWLVPDPSRHRERVAATGRNLFVMTLT